MSKTCSKPNTQATSINEEERQTSNLRLQWKFADSTIWTDKMLMALVNGVRNGVWHSLIDKVYRPSTLWTSWEKVAANRGAAGIDSITVERFAAKADIYLNELHESLKNGTYKPQAVKRVYIPKGNGKKRPLGIPTVKDRIVQMAIKLAIEPIYENKFCDNSFGFRPGRGAKDALREVDKAIQAGYTWVVDADIKAYFDSISHNKLMKLLRKDIADKQLLKLIESFLKQNIAEELKEWTPIMGTPQGAVLSPLLSNLYLHELDRIAEESNVTMIRYADDFVILTKSEEHAKRIFKGVCLWASSRELTIHPEKSHVGNCMIEGEGFEFLGYRFEAGKKSIRKQSLRKLKGNVKKKTRRTCGKSLKMVIKSLNRTLVGWYNYFKHISNGEYVFQRIDGGIRKRLRAILRKQEKRPGRGRTRADHMKWPNRYFAKEGLVSLKTKLILEITNQSL